MKALESRTNSPLDLRIPAAAALALAILVTAGCDSESSPTEALPDSEVRDVIERFGLSPLPDIPYPPDNRHDPARISLGRLLFFDPILGGESAPWIKEAAGKAPYRFRGNDVACATCHHPTLGFADGRPLSAGVSGGQFNGFDLGPERVVPGQSLITGLPVGIEPRNAPTIFNTAFNGFNSITPTSESFMFLDGRVTEGLEEQAILPITSRDEMAGDAYSADVAQDSVAARVAAIPEYVARFAQAFPGEIAGAEDLDITHVARALAAYERELITPGSRYDQFVGGRYDVFSEQEREGFHLFFGKGLCGDCHSGPMLSDFTMRIQGVGDDYEGVHPGFLGKNGQGGDFGRFHADSVAFANDKYAFRTLTVRMVEMTGPYFHSGSARTLREVIEFYNRGGLGGQDITDAQLAEVGAVRDPSIRPLDLTDDEIDALIAFMRTTTAPVQPGPSGLDLTAVPQRVPSGLLPPGVPTPAGPGPYLVKGKTEPPTG